MVLIICMAALQAEAQELRLTNSSAAQMPTYTGQPQGSTLAPGPHPFSQRFARQDILNMFVVLFAVSVGVILLIIFLWLLAELALMCVERLSEWFKFLAVRGTVFSRLLSASYAPYVIVMFLAACFLYFTSTTKRS